MFYRAMIFDMDGTIIDTECVWETATCQLLESKKVPCSPEIVCMIRTKIQGLDSHNSCRIIKELTGMTDPIDKIQEEKENLAHKYYEAGIKYIPGFVEFHTKLHEQGIKTAIATNAREHTIELTQNSLNIRQFFNEHIYGLDHVKGKGKPNPDLYLLAAQKLGIEPRLCLAIEDSAHGIAAAQAAGMFCIGINTNKKYEQVKKADYIVERYDQIDFDLIFGKTTNDTKK